MSQLKAVLRYQDSVCYVPVNRQGREAGLSDRNFGIAATEFVMRL